MDPERPSFQPVRDDVLNGIRVATGKLAVAQEGFTAGDLALAREFLEGAQRTLDITSIYLDAFEALAARPAR